MATAAEIRQQINDLQNRLMMKEIELDDYFVEYEVLNKKLQNQLASETQIEPRDFQFTEPGLQAEVESKLRGYGDYTVPYELKPKDVKKREEELGRKLTVEDTRQLEQDSIRQFQKDFERFKFGTKQFRDPYTVSKSMSRILDPKTGMVFDKKTGRLRKPKGLETSDLPIKKTIAGAITTNPVLKNLIGMGLDSLGFDELIDKSVKTRKTKDEDGNIVTDKVIIPSPTAELLVEALKPQRIATPEQAKQMEAIKKESRQRREEDLRRFFKKQGKTDKEVEEAIKEREGEFFRFTDDIRPFAFGQKSKDIGEDVAKRFLTQTPHLEAGIVETPLAAGLRALNTTSAFAAPALDWVNDLAQTDVGRSVIAGTATSGLPTYLQPFVSQVVSDTMKEKLAPIATREGAGYEKTEMKGPLGQAFTNMILGQGLFSQLGAQSLPPETNYNPLDPTVQGSFANTVTTILPEFAVPVLPAGMVVKPAQAVTRGILFAGQRKALENAFKSFRSTKAGKDLTSIKVTVNDLLEPHTVSYKASEMGADIVAGSKLRDRLPARSTYADMESLSNKIPQSRYLKTIHRVPSVEPILQGNFASGVDPLLRGVNKVANETIRVIEKGGKPKVAADLISRGVAVSRLRNIPLDEVEKVVVKQKNNAVTAAWEKTRGLLERSKLGPLQADQQTILREALDVLNKNKVYEQVPESIRNSEEVIYDAIRSSTSQVIRDNLLRTMPVDLVYISNNVAVPKSKISTATGRPTKEYTKYLEEHRELLDFESKAVNNQEVYEFTPDRLAALRGFQQQHGMQFSPGVTQKLENGEAFTAIERQELFDGVGAQLALDHLDGTRLRTAGLQSDLADAGIVASDTFFSSVRGKKATFDIKAKGLANAIRILKGRPTDTINFFDDTASASFKNFERSVQLAADAAPKQVIDSLKTATKAMGPDEVKQVINVQSKRYMDMGVELERSSRKSMAIRADQPQISDVSPTARKDFVGASPYEQKFRNRLQKKIEQKRQARAEKKQQRIKSLSKIKTQQEESFAKLTEAQEESLAKLVEAQEESIENLIKKQRASLAKLKSSQNIKNKKLEQRIAEKIAKQEEILAKRKQKQQEIVEKRVDKQEEILAKLLENQKVSIENLTTKQRASLAKLMSSKKKIKDKQQKIAEKIAKQKQKIVEKIAKQEEVVSKRKEKQQESFAKLTEVQEESLAKLVEAQEESLAKLKSSQQKIKDKQQKQEIAEKIAKQKKFYEERLAKQQEIVAKRKEKQQEIRTTRATEQKEIFDKKVKAAVESEMKDLQKLSEEESKINNQIDEYIKDIREDQISKSKETAKRRTLQAASERYGHKQVKDFIEDAVGYKNLEYDDLATVIDDLVDYMDVYEEGFIRYSQWEDVLKNFFVGPEIAIKQKKVISTSKILEFVREQDQLLKMIVEDPEQPFFAPNNLKPINPSKLKEVVEGLRKGPGGDILQKYGLKKGIFSRDENFVLPILQKMMSIQKLQNTQEAIAKFARTEPDIVLSMKRTQEGMVGLESVEAISQEVQKTIGETLAAGDKMKIFSDDLKNIVFYQIKEILFDGMMRDVWVNTSRSTQEKFLQKYLNKMVLEETVAINMDDFLRTVIIAEKDKTPLIRSKTFDRINERLENVLERVQQNLSFEGKKKDADIEFVERKIEVVEKIKESLPDMIQTMNVEYLGKLTGIGKGPLSDSLFAQQIQQVTDRMTMYGLNGNTLSKALKSINPRIKMIGNENLALVYGQELAERAKLITEMTESKYFESVFKSQAFNKYAQQAFKKDVKGTINRGEILTQIALNTVFGTLNMFRRWTTAAMLGGQFAPNTRFFGFNRLTAPFILAGTVLNAPLRLPSVARILGRSFDMGLERPAKSAFNMFMRKLGKPYVWDLSAANKLRFAPPEEVVVFAKDGAKRDYTAGELRRIINESGMEYSRADAEFFDSEVNAMLIELGINEQGLNRYRSQHKWLRDYPRLYKVGKKILENTRTSQNNIFTQLSKYQDSELRRVAFVEYLRNGYSLEEAVTAGKSSMLDYSILTPGEKRYASNLIWFYAFQRTMMTSQINAIYKGVMTGKPSLSLRMLRSQDVLNRQMAEDYNDYTDQQLGRVYNIFAGEIDKIPLTLGGPPNPQIQLLDIISTGLVANSPSELIDTVWFYLREQNPYSNPFLQYYRAESSGRIPPFPSYLQYDAEASGNLEYFIERYGLIPRRKMPGKTLTMGSEETDAGVLYDFPEGEKGLPGYKQYLIDQTLGLTAAGVLINQGLDVLAKEEGIPVDDLFVRLFGQRFKRDLTKAEMLSSKRGDRIVTPEGEEVVPFEGRYLKSGTIQGGKIGEVFEGDTQNAILWSLYQLGLVTPLKGAPAEKNIIYQLNRVKRALDQADKESQ